MGHELWPLVDTPCQVTPKMGCSLNNALITEIWWREENLSLSFLWRPHSSRVAHRNPFSIMIVHFYFIKHFRQKCRFNCKMIRCWRELLLCITPPLKETFVNDTAILFMINGSVLPKEYCSIKDQLVKKTMKILDYVLNFLFVAICCVHVGIIVYIFINPPTPEIKVYEQELKDIEFPVAFILCVDKIENSSRAYTRIRGLGCILHRIWKSQRQSGLEWTE